MATRKSSRRVDRHGTTPSADDNISAACLVSRHARCKAEVISLAYVGPCRCRCHAAPLPDPWKRLDASEAGALSAPNPFALPPCEQDGEVA